MAARSVQAQVMDTAKPDIVQVRVAGDGHARKKNIKTIVIAAIMWLFVFIVVVVVVFNHFAVHVSQ